MPTVAKRGKRWRARARVDGKQADAGSYKTKVEALAAALEMERARRAGRSPYGTIFRDLLERYAAQVSPGKKGARWEANRLAYYGRDDVALTPVAKLTPGVFAALRDRRLRQGASGSSIHRDFNLLSHVCRIAWKEWLWLDGNPVSDVRRP